MGVTATENHHPYRLSLIQAVGIAVTIAAVAMLIVLMVLIHRKHQELEETENLDKGSAKAFPPPRPMRKFQEGQTSMFQKFSYMETKKATNNFNTVIGQGGFGTVYKAQFDDGFVAAVKRMNMVSEQGEDDFCREIEFLARFHQRQLVALRGFCIRKRERVYGSRIHQDHIVAEAFCLKMALHNLLPIYFLSQLANFPGSCKSYRWSLRYCNCVYVYMRFLQPENSQN